jgi:hypothetical protein
LSNAGIGDDESANVRVEPQLEVDGIDLARETEPPPNQPQAFVSEGLDFPIVPAEFLAPHPPV